MDLLVWFWAQYRCKTQVFLRISPWSDCQWVTVRIFSQRGEFVVPSGRLGPVKHARPSHHLFWQRVTPNVTRITASKSVLFCLICPQNILPKVLRVIKIFFFSDTMRCKMGLRVSVSQHWFLPWNSPVDAQSLSNYWIMNTHINWSEACIVLHVLTGWNISWRYFDRLGRCSTSPCFLYLLLTTLTVVPCILKALEMALLPFSDFYMPMT